MKLSSFTVVAMKVFVTAFIFIVSGCQTESANDNARAIPSTVEGITLLETVDPMPADGRDIVIPYRKYQLANGLVLILHEDRSDPLVHVDVTYHVGSGREERGKSGFAHFFEHMMFQGSENVADEAHFKIITEAGGILNGTTNMDRTNYFETAPANQLEKLLWLEADRMGFLLDTVTQEKFEVQRETVKNERGQNVDNRPYGRLNERVNEALYPEGHPYSWPVIGYIQDLDRVDVNDLKRFFLRWYGPNNATLTIGGDFDRDQALVWVKKYFGPILRGPEVAMPEKSPVTLVANRYISYEDNVAVPLLYMAYPTVYLRHADEAALDVLMSILGQGKTSLLYKNLVKEGDAVQASAGHPCLELSCSFTFYAFQNPQSGKTLTDLEAIIHKTVDEVEKRGVTDDDLLRVKMNIVSGMVYGLESVRGKVSQLAENETYTGNPNRIAEDIARYERVSKADVIRVYKQYIKDKAAVIMSVFPSGQPELVARADSWSRDERFKPKMLQPDTANFNISQIQDDFDRSRTPKSGANPGLSMPELWRGNLANAVPVLAAINTEVPTTTINLRIFAGQREESLDKLGLAHLTATLMNEATNLSGNEQLSNRLQKLGSHITFSADNDATTLSIRSLTENLEATLAIAAEKLLSPKFGLLDFERVQMQMLQAIEQRKKRASVTANDVFQGLLYGQNNAFAHNILGTAESIQALTVQDVKAFYEEYYSPRIAGIVAVSDLEKNALLEKLRVFGPWQGLAVSKNHLKQFPPLDGLTLYLVDKPSAPQSEIRIGKRSISFDATGEYYLLELMNFPLGGAFNSRINLNLREEKGYTYGARTGFRGAKQYGSFIASASVRSDATAASIVEFIREIRVFSKKGPTSSELEFTQKAFGQRDALRFETPHQKLTFLSKIQKYSLDDEFVSQQNTILASTTTQQLKNLAIKHLSADDMIILVVGDKQSILPELKDLGYKIVLLDADGVAL
ncbi:MAG: insulinase family protein [Pseudomonadales bacterium]|nr:insulinase family protein [Pseudomonadales bacterium]